MAFLYQGEQLSLKLKGKNLALADLVHSHGSPLYVYNLDFILNRIEIVKKSLGLRAKLHYAMKANANREILQAMKSQSQIGVDVVSGGEIKRALECGFEGRDILFSGVGKSTDELRLALKTQVKQINVESYPELKRILKLAREMKHKISIAFRMNPDVDPVTHPYIKTGVRENKFGIDESFLPEMLKLVSENKDVLNLQGLTLHIGSQLRDGKALFEAIQKTKRIYQNLQAQGWALGTFDIGGGWGIDYHSPADENEDSFIAHLAQEIGAELKDLDGEILAEPGRIIVARAGALIGQVEYIKETPFKNFAILNTGMHHLIRPALYQAFHRIERLTHSTKSLKTYDVVGPICESSDVLGRDRRLADLQEGEYVAILDSGAYGFSMSSHYNLHDSPKEIVIGSN